MQAYKSSPLSADITKIVKANYDPPPGEIFSALEILEGLSSIKVFK